jgi:hypothetical protein
MFFYFTHRWLGKLECLFAARFLWQIKCLGVRPSSHTLVCSRPASQLMTNTIAYLCHGLAKKNVCLVSMSQSFLNRNKGLAKKSYSVCPCQLFQASVILAGKAIEWASLSCMVMLAHT